MGHLVLKHSRIAKTIDAKEMKQIQEYLLSKKNNKTNVMFHLNVKKGALKTKQDVIDFFEFNGFKRINSDSLERFFEKFENSSIPVYWTGTFNQEMSKWVRFGKGGKISEDNPVMFWRINETNTTYCGYNYGYATGPKNNTNIDTHIIKSFDEFKEFVNKIF